MEGVLESREENSSEKRFAIIVEEPVQKELAKLAKLHGVSQSVVTKTLLEIVDPERLKSSLEDKRAEKVAGRVSKTSLLKQLSGLDQEQLATLLKQLNQS